MINRRSFLSALGAGCALATKGGAQPANAGSQLFWTVDTTSGKVHNGLIRKETSDEITLATGPREEVRIPRGDIEEIRPSTVSIMPSGLDQQLTTQQLADLIAFLKNAK